jgi:hypothetical protein
MTDSESLGRRLWVGICLPGTSLSSGRGIVGGWVKEIGLDSALYGTHSMRRTKPTLIHRRTKNQTEV